MPGPSDYVLFGLFSDKSWNFFGSIFGIMAACVIGAGLMMLMIIPVLLIMGAIDSLILWYRLWTGQTTSVQLEQDRQQIETRIVQEKIAARQQRKREKQDLHTYAGAKHFVELMGEKHKRDLKLYGLQMQADYGDNTTNCPSRDNMCPVTVDRWQEWMSRKGLSREDAGRKYAKRVVKLYKKEIKN